MLDISCNIGLSGLRFENVYYNCQPLCFEMCLDLRSFDRDRFVLRRSYSAKASDVCFLWILASLFRVFFDLSFIVCMCAPNPYLVNIRSIRTKYYNVNLFFFLFRYIKEILNSILY